MEDPRYSMQHCIDISYEYSQYMLCLRRLELHCAVAKRLVFIFESRRNNLSASECNALLKLLRVISISIGDGMSMLGVCSDGVRILASCKEFPTIRIILDVYVSRVRQKFAAKIPKRVSIWERIFRRREAVMLMEIEKCLLRELCWKYVLEAIYRKKNQYQ